MQSDAKNSLLQTLALSAALAAAAGCAHRDRVTVVQSPNPAPQTVVVEKDRPAERVNTLIVREAPPPPREESVPEPPAPDKAWAPGHWEYQDNRYTWISGHWETKPQPNASYVAAHWESRDGGYVYVSGYWKY